MNDNTADIGKLILRAYIGLAMLGHGIPKILGGIGGVEGLLANQGLPGLLAYGVYVGEVVAPIMLILGLYARIGGVLIVINMLFAIALAHTDEIFALTERGAWALELQGFYLFGGLAVALIGAGRYALRPEA